MEHSFSNTVFLLESAKRGPSRSARVNATAHRDLEGVMTRTRLVVKVATTAAALVLCAAMTYAGDSPAGGVFMDAKTGMEFVSVKGGCYQMGDTFGVGDGDERPAHEVCISDFHIGKFEVTQGEWEKVMGGNPSYFKKGPRYPVEQVSWNDAQEFLRKMNATSGKQYRLPTEAEWEYAARSGGKLEKYAGFSDLPDLESYAWYEKNAGGSTHPVGGKKPNGLGLYDMTGNVFEWVHDWKGNYSSSSRDDPQGPSSGSYRVLRGGSWNYIPRLLRASARNLHPPDARLSSYGFRVAFSAQ
ncbi:MAG: protein 3-oxoalanine-rating enzyme family protein [Deltaproteobacteria bacterium]|nr:protein 3-oxoalanine-rating enzyme family protein [Deltaproteobacteria bacterium]